MGHYNWMICIAKDLPTKLKQWNHDAHDLPETGENRQPLHLHLHLHRHLQKSINFRLSAFEPRETAGPCSLCEVQLVLRQAEEAFPPCHVGEVLPAIQHPGTFDSRRFLPCLGL